MNIALYNKTIKNVALQTDICLFNEMEKALTLTKHLQCVHFRVFDVKIASSNEQLEIVAAEEQQQRKALIGIKMRKFNHCINKPFVNGYCLQE